MFAYFALFLAAFLDPAAFVFSLVIIYFLEKKLGTITTVLLSGLVGYLFAEYMLMQSQGSRVFGEYIITGLPAKIAVAFIALLAIRFFRKIRLIT